MNNPLPPQYYLHNFRLMIDWVIARYEDLLSEEERTFATQFAQLDINSQCLLVRMISRKGPWFRADKLQYAEIDNQDQAAEQLILANLITTDEPLTLSELASILTKPELLLLFSQQLSAYKTERKDTLIQILDEAHPESQCWSQWTQHQFGKLYYLDVQHIIKTFLLLFFGNPYQDLTEFVLQDLGLYRYEEYEIDQQHRIFKSREEITQYQQLMQLRDYLEEADDVNELEEIVLQLPDKFASATMERRYARFINQLAYEFERYEQTGMAMQLYQLVELPPSRERQIRLLEKQGHHQQAWQLLTCLTENPANEHELQIAERMAPRLAKKAGESFKKKSTVNMLEKNLILPQLTDEFGQFLSVEEIARRHFDTTEEPCFYVENELLNGLFGLWLWPEMFRSIDGAFANLFQTAPLDLYQEDFQKNRPDLSKLLALLDEKIHHQHIVSVWQQKQGIANHFVNWQFIDETILKIALQCIDANHLKHIFQRLLFDLKANRSGLPDLIQFFPATNSYRMIEVKGPGDRIQDNQQRWLHFFSMHGIPAEVCYVSWQ